MPHSRIQVELGFILQAVTRFSILLKIQDRAKVFKTQHIMLHIKLSSWPQVPNHCACYAQVGLSYKFSERTWQTIFYNNKSSIMITIMQLLSTQYLPQDLIINITIFSIGHSMLIIIFSCVSSSITLNFKNRLTYRLTDRHLALYSFASFCTVIHGLC